MSPQAYLLLLTFLTLTSCQPGVCPELCSNCYGDPYQCYSCHQHYNLPPDEILFTGQCSCPLGFYRNPTTSLCDFCDISCETCVNSTQCTTCFGDLIRDEATGLCVISQPYQYRVVSELTTRNITELIIPGYRLLYATDSTSIAGYVTQCTKLGENIFGGSRFPYRATVTKAFYNIPRHQWMKIRFNFVAIDSWVNDSLILAIDNINNYDEANIYSYRQLKNFTYNNTQHYADYCGASLPDSLGRMDAAISHTSAMVKMRIHTNYLNQTNNNTNMYWGFKDLLIIVGQCHRTCLTCTSSTPDSCLTCQPGYILSGSSCICDPTNNN
jgi:hypothetical protein